MGRTPGKAPRRGANRTQPRKTFTPPLGFGSTSGEPPPAVRKPLIDIDPASIRQWTWEDHALERCQERGIGVFEVLSTIHQPDWSVYNKNNRRWELIRGDVHVVVNLRDRRIITAMDRNHPRTTPRQPLHPPTSIVDTPQEERQVTTVNDAPTTVSVVGQWIDDHPYGWTFTTRDAIVHAHGQMDTTDSAVRQALVAILAKRTISRVGDPRSARWIKTQPDEEPEVRNVEEPQTRKTPAVKFGFTFVDMLPAQGYREELVASIRENIGELKSRPGVWARIAEMNCRPETAHRTGKFVRQQLAMGSSDEVMVEVETRRVTPGDDENHGIYVRWPQ